jgi:hypothetical protein
MGVEVVGTIGPRLRRGETAGEFAQRVTVEAPACANAMSQLATLFGKARYSRPSVTGKDVLVAKATLLDLQANVRNMRNEARASRRLARAR